MCTVAQHERENQQVEEPVEIVFRSDVLRLDTPPEGDTTILTPFFSINPEYLGGTVAAPDGDWPAALDEAVEQRVLDNIWGVYTVGAVEPVDRYESRFRACDGQHCFRDPAGVDHFVTGPLYTIDLWVIYYMAERGWNSVRLARAPFDPPLTVCLPRVQTDRFAAWDKKQMRWRLLEAVESPDSSLTCAYTSILDAFIAVKD